ncbi:hypothetical protein D3C78_1219630 [compost metagenome]
MRAKPDFFENRWLGIYRQIAKLSHQLTRLAFLIDMKHLQLNCQVGIRIVIHINLADISFLFRIVELLDLILNALMNIDRFLMNKRRCAEAVYLSKHTAAVCIIYNNEIFLSRRPQRDVVGREGLLHPIPSPSRFMQHLLLD